MASRILQCHRVQRVPARPWNQLCIACAGPDDELAHSSIRFTIGRFTTAEEVDYATQLIKGAVVKLRDLSPLWEMHKEGIDLKTVEWAAH